MKILYYALLPFLNFLELHPCQRFRLPGKLPLQRGRALRLVIAAGAWKAASSCEPHFATLCVPRLSFFEKRGFFCLLLRWSNGDLP